MKHVSTWALPVLAVVVLAFAWWHPLPAINHDCVRHGGMLPLNPTDSNFRFCIDNNRVVHYFPQSQMNGVVEHVQDLDGDRTHDVKP